MALQRWRIFWFLDYISTLFVYNYIISVEQPFWASNTTDRQQNFSHESESFKHTSTTQYIWRQINSSCRDH